MTIIRGPYIGQCVECGRLCAPESKGEVIRECPYCEGTLKVINGRNNILELKNTLCVPSTEAS